jgi:hypothetical protein
MIPLAAGRAARLLFLWGGGRRFLGGVADADDGRRRAMINHVVVLKFKPEVPPDAVRELERMLDDLPNKIMEIKMFEFGPDRLHSPRSHDFALVALFTNLAALERYRNHPAHRPVLEKIAALCDSVVTVDFEGADSASTEAGPPEWERDPFERLKL